MAPPSTSLEEDLQILRLTSPSTGWTSLLPHGTAPGASFYLFTASPSPSSSEGEGQAQMHDPNRIKPPQENVDAAAYWMCQFLETFIGDGQFAIAGGYAMRIHGSNRQTFDVDICVKPAPGTPPPLGEMIQFPRVILPSVKMFTGVLRFYVKTGPGFGDDIEFDRVVKIDFMLGDFLPSRFTDHTMTLYIDTQEVRVLDRECLLKCKLRAYRNRPTQNDYDDIKNLIFSEPEETRGYRDQLDPETIEFFIDQALVPNESGEIVQQAKYILMLTEPPSPSAAGNH